MELKTLRQLPWLLLCIELKLLDFFRMGAIIKTVETKLERGRQTELQKRCQASARVTKAAVVEHNEGDKALGLFF